MSMVKEEDRQRLVKLRDEIEDLKHERIDHQHPKFKAWRKETMVTLKRLYGAGSPILRQFEELSFRRREDRMWGEEYDIAEKERVVFKGDLERARTIFEEATKLAYLLGEEEAGVGEAEFIRSVSKKRLQREISPLTEEVAPEEVAPEVPAEVVEKEVEDDIDQLLQELEKDKRELERVQATLEEVMEGIQIRSEEGKVEELLQQLERQIKDPHVEMRKVQRTMEDLLKAKGREALVQRLTQETRDPKAPWGKIKGLMRGVWEIDKQFFLDILPDILKD